MTRPLVSVVLPVFERPTLVSAALRSVQDQAGVDAEIIVVDDGSADRTPGVLTAFARRDRRIRLLRTEHLGPAGARNAGVDVARGEYLTFLDSDDLYPAGRIGRQIDKLARRPDAVAIVGALRFFGDEAGDEPIAPEPMPFHNAALQAATFRTGDFRTFGPLDETLEYAEDVDFFLRLLERDARLIIESEVACLYRRHEHNMTLDIRAKEQGYVRAYARSIARRRASGRTRPLESFFPRRFDRGVDFGAGEVLQEIRAVTEPPGLLAFVNAFYLGYWRALADLRSLCAVLRVAGRGTVRLRQTTGGGESIVVAETRVAGERVQLDVPQTALSRESVLEIEADEGVVILGGAWVTFDEPRRDIRLAIVICSLHRPQAVQENLQRLAGTDAQIIVVHQGTDALDVPDGVTLLAQPNFGGSGGFTRGILHALDAGCTHVLLLDDDVRVEPELVARLRGLMSYVVEPTTIGGQMLDLERPVTLAASHESVDLQRLELINPLAETDLSAPGAPAVFARRHVGDYAAWWCCCIPAESLRDALPLPLFIRHDDVEHGLRMTRSGSPVVTMPGIFIWHEPFTSKVKLWYTYYDRRNKLIVGALHGSIGGRRLATMFLRDCLPVLTALRYDLGWAACQAVRDFLAGPAVVFTDPRPRHEAIVAGLARTALQTVREHRTRMASRGSGRARLRPDRVVPPPASRALAGEILGCAVRLLVMSGRVSGEYRATREHYASATFWRDYLDLGP